MKTPIGLFLAIVAVLIMTGRASALEVTQSIFDQKLIEARYSIQTGETSNGASWAADSGSASGKSHYTYKSPGKAFLLSIAVPGLGQYYYGSRIKPWLFFGTEVATWALYLKWHGDGNDLTDKFEQFQRNNWSRATYAEYLDSAYGVTDDDSISAKEISHHLPDTETGQYFEMTGKYNQFAWGWNDAQRDGQSFDYWKKMGTELRITGPDETPISAKRTAYELMRHDANHKFDQATNMLIVALANRLLSGFEAYFTTKSHNNARQKSDHEFSQVHFETTLKSMNTRRDTPFLTAFYRF